MKKMNFDKFITRNQLRPISAAEAIPLAEQPLSLPELRNYIAANELNAEDFYINSHNPEKPYSYYRGAVFFEFDDFTALKQRIVTMENRLNQTIADRNFTAFLKTVDARLAPDLFMEVFNFIPDPEKYPLFIRLIKDNPYSQDIFSADFSKQAARYKNATESMPLADERGNVKIFTWITGIAELENRDIWYTDINNAIGKMLSNGLPAELFQASVNVKNIKSYRGHKSKKTVLLNPRRVTNPHPMEMLKISELPELMRRQGLNEHYFHYANQIENEWFHNPQGIHAVGHTKRVLLLGLLLSHLEQLSAPDRDLICQASIYHDIGRITDGYDTSHGVASYKKLMDKDLISRISAAERENLRFVIELHAIADRAAHKQLHKYDLTDVTRTLKLYHVFKDADGLDRVRIRDLNLDYLRNPGAHKLVLLAHQLLRNPEYEKLLADY